MAQAYAFEAAGSEASTSGGSYSATLTPSLPTGTPAPIVGDVMFLWAKGQHSAVYQVWSAPAGWTALGSPIHLDDGNVGGARWHALQLWVRSATASESNPTVTDTTGGSSGGTARAWQTGVFTYRPPVGTPLFGLIVPCVDESHAAATSYTPSAITVPVDATVVTFVAQAGVSGTLTIATAQGFTTRLTLTNTPAARILDKAVSAGSVTMPTVSSGFSRPWMSKTFAFDRRANSGWSVGRLAW